MPRPRRNPPYTCGHDRCRPISEEARCDVAHSKGAACRPGMLAPHQATYGGRVVRCLLVYLAATIAAGLAPEVGRPAYVCTSKRGSERVQMDMSETAAPEHTGVQDRLEDGWKECDSLGWMTTGDCGDHGTSWAQKWHDREFHVTWHTSVIIHVARRASAAPCTRHRCPTGGP